VRPRINPVPVNALMAVQQAGFARGESQAMQVVGTVMNQLIQAGWTPPKPTVKNCCCNYGAAVAGEWPEFGCYLCEVHRHGMGEQPNEMCKRHRKALRGTR